MHETIRIHARAPSPDVGLRCPYCRDRFAPGEQAKVCLSCGGPSHPDCWEAYYDRCPTCAGVLGQLDRVGGPFVVVRPRGQGGAQLRPKRRPSVPVGRLARRPPAWQSDNVLAKLAEYCGAIATILLGATGYVLFPLLGLCGFFGWLWIPLCKALWSIGQGSMDEAWGHVSAFLVVPVVVTLRLLLCTAFSLLGPVLTAAFGIGLAHGLVEAGREWDLSVGRRYR